MATKLQWSVCEQDRSITAPLVERFRAQYPGVAVEVISIPWGSYKNELTQIAIHHQGTMDVSQAGAPVVNDLLAMNALRPFTSREVAELGGENSFVPNAWKSSIRVADGKVWSIPLFADPRAIVYWSDLLENAGVDEEGAFSSFSQMDETLQRLRANGIEAPWIMNVWDRYLCTQCASSWIWASGADFVSPETGKSQFTSQTAIEGLKVYCGLIRYMHADLSKLDWSTLVDLFTHRQAAVAIVNLGTALNWYNNAPQELRPRLRVAQPPGPAYVGGSSLVVWDHCPSEMPAVNLVKFLTSTEVQTFYPLQVGQLPVRHQVLAQSSFLENPIIAGFSRILESGRTFPNVKLGGLLEDLLVHAFDRIWKTLVAEPHTNPEEVLMQFLGPIARRYDMMMIN